MRWDRLSWVETYFTSNLMLLTTQIFMLGTLPLVLQVRCTSPRTPPSHLRLHCLLRLRLHPRLRPRLHRRRRLLQAALRIEDEPAGLTGYGLLAGLLGLLPLLVFWSFTAMDFNLRKNGAALNSPRHDPFSSPRHSR